MTCDNCGHELDQRWNYCPTCAEPTPTIKAALPMFDYEDADKKRLDAMIENGWDVTMWMIDGTPVYNVYDEDELVSVSDQRFSNGRDAIDCAIRNKEQR